MIQKVKEFEGFPSEIWQIILTFLDLKTQHFLSRLSKEFYLITLSLWKIRLRKIHRKISSVPFDYKEARTNLTMLSFLNDRHKPVEEYSLSELHDLLCKFDALSSLERERKETTKSSEVRIVRIEL